jgi:hypothetical protein
MSGLARVMTDTIIWRVLIWCGGEMLMVWYTS